MSSTVERKAENEAIFRDANEKIATVRRGLQHVEGRTPFFCECEDDECRELVRLDFGEYEAVRANPTAFIIARGHPYTSGRVLDDRDAYLVVEKHGEAGRVAVDRDPRSGGG
jgi:hypothetical protein